MATAGSDKLTRRGGRRPPVREPVDVGAALREAREAVGTTLGEIRDRTGVPWQHLEALEAMELARLPDQRSVVIAARRYAEVVGLDAPEVCGTALRAWQDEHWSPPRPPAVGRPATAPPAQGTGRWRRRNGATGAARPGRHPPDPGSASDPATQVLPSRAADTRPHLRAFTETAEVPPVPGTGGGGKSSPFADTAGVPAASHVGAGAVRTPRWLLLTVAAVALLVVIGVGGLLVQHFEPGWLSAVHHRQGAQAAQGTPSTPSRPPGAGPRQQLVDQVQTGSSSATVTVHAGSYQVLVAAQQPCWIQATDPSGSSGSVFTGVLGTGETKTLDPVGGRLSVQFGASLVTVQVQVRGKPVRGWSYTPASAPFTLDFVSG